MRTLGDVLYNFHWIVPGKAARSAQAYAGFLGPFLRHRGIRSVINLRGPNPAWRWWRYEKSTCAQLEIEHHDVTLSSKNVSTRAMLVTLLDAFDSAARPFLMKCSGGQDRTSFAAALYILHARGWYAFEEAQRQFAGWPYLHWPRQNQRWLKLFAEFAQESAQGMPLRVWVETKFSQEDFKHWLEGRGQASSFRAFHH